MGYRSDVVMAVSIKKEEVARCMLLGINVQALFEKVFEDVWVIDDFACFNDPGLSQPVIYGQAYSVKWYSSFSQVAEIENFISTLDSTKIDYGFMRLGEELEDVEIHGDIYKFGIELERAIYAPSPKDS